MLWHQKKLSGLFYYIIPTLIYKTHEMSKRTEKKQLRKDMEKKKKTSIEFYAKYLPSHNVLNLQMDIGYCSWDFTDEENEAQVSSVDTGRPHPF